MAGGRESLDVYHTPGYDLAMRENVTDENRLELFAVTPVETGERAIPVVNSRRLVASVHSLEAAASHATVHAEINCGDGDFVVNDVTGGEGREVARIAVRAGRARITPRPEPGPTPAEELRSLYEPCPYCSSEMVLIPCLGCRARRCGRCMARRLCCNPDKL
jgi:hypothetical protein